MDSDYQTWLNIFLYSFVLIFGIIANSLVVIFFAFKIKRHTTFRWFIVQLAIADCIVCIITPGLTFYLMYNNGNWYLGPFLCKVITPIGFITVNVSAWILCAIAYERFRAIGNPLKPRYSRKHVNLICMFMWIGSIIVALPLFLYTDVRGSQCVPVWNRDQHLVLGIIGLISQSVIPILLMGFTFLAIRNAFVKQELNTSNTLKGFNDRQKSKSIRLKSKMTTQTLLIAFGVFVLCSLPYNLLYVIAVVMFRFDVYSTTEKMHQIQIYDQVGFWLSYLVVLNSVMNCLIYAGKFPTFRRFILTQICRRRPGNPCNNNNLKEISLTTVKSYALTVINNNGDLCPFNETPEKGERIPLEKTELLIQSPSNF